MMRITCVLAVGLSLLFPLVAGTGDLPADSTSRIGVLVTGVESTDGSDPAIIHGVQRAVDEWGGQHPERAGNVGIVIIRANTRWDSQTSDIVQSIFENRLPVVIGASNRRTAHLAGQVITRLKGSTLLIAISEDETLTKIGVPWILRMGASPPLERGADGGGVQVPEVLARDAGYAVLQAISACGADALKIRDYLGTHRFSSGPGEFTFDRSGNRVSAAPR
jgi:hypothetical protein